MALSSEPLAAAPPRGTQTLGWRRGGHTASAGEEGRPASGRGSRQAFAPQPGWGWAGRGWAGLGGAWTAGALGPAGALRAARGTVGSQGPAAHGRSETRTDMVCSPGEGSGSTPEGGPGEEPGATTAPGRRRGRSGQAGSLRPCAW